MKYIFASILLLVSVSLFGQETTPKKKGNESYNVLKNDKDVKQGEYIKMQKKVIVEKGQYDNNVRTGIWEFYDPTGALEQKYDYTLRKVTFVDEAKRFPEHSSCSIVLDGKVTGEVPDALPIFIGGRSRYERFIEENLKYPSDSKSKGTEGRLFAAVTLTKDGKIINEHIIQGIATDISEEAIRLLKLLPDDWIVPARNNNKAVDVQIFFPVVFRLSY